MLVKVSDTTQPGTRVWNGALMRQATLIEVRDQAALVVYDKKPTEVAPAPIAVLTILRDRAQPGFRQERQSQFTPSPVSSDEHADHMARAHNLGIMEVRLLTIYHTATRMSDPDRRVNPHDEKNVWRRIAEDIRDSVSRLESIDSMGPNDGKTFMLSCMDDPCTTNTPKEQ